MGRKKYKSNSRDIEKICKNAAYKVDRSAVDEFEIYAASSIRNEIEIYNSNVESLSFSDSTGIGVRIFKDKSIGYAYTEILEEKEIRDCIERAISNSLVTSKEEYNFLPKESEFKYKSNKIDKNILFREDFLKYSIVDKINIGKKLEIITKEKDRRIAGIDSLMYNDSLSEVAILNSSGFFDKYKATACFIYINVISKQNGDTSTGDYFGYARSPRDLNLEEISANAVERSVSILGGKKIKSQKVDVILDPLVSAQFLSVIANSLTADYVQKGKSLFKDKRGNKVFNIDINIIDDGIMPDGLASKPFDGEGVPRGKTVVIKSGVLNTFLYDIYTARKDGTQSTGNAVRASYESSPRVGLSNFYIKSSNNTFEELIGCVDKGFYVMDIIGLHSGANPISGEISVGAKGLWIDKGSLQFPVKEVTIATDILSLCKSIDKVGSDLKFLPSGGYIGSPSLLVRDIMVGGSKDI